MNSLQEPIAERNFRLYPRRTDNRYYGLTRLRQALEKVIVRYIAPLHNGKGDLIAVDMGCGTMPYRALLAPYVKYMGADLVANEHADLILDPESGRINQPSETVDVVLSTQVLEHVASPTDYLAEARRICKPNGLLILSTHGYWQYHPDPNDYWRWTSDGLIKLLRDQGWRPMELIGILGFASAAMSLMQDALAPKIPPRLQTIFGVCMQQAVGFLDYWYKPEDRQENAAVFLLVAERE